MKRLENKIPPPLVAIICAVGMWIIAQQDSMLISSTYLQYLVSILFILLGLGFCIAGIVSFRKADTTVNPLKPETATHLVTSGIYQVTRNPMYVGFALFLCGWAVFLASYVAIGGVIINILFINRFQVQPEERALEEVFGDDYLEYKTKVRPWL